jgi:hypothetical protein
MRFSHLVPCLSVPEVPVFEMLSPTSVNPVDAAVPISSSAVVSVLPITFAAAATIANAAINVDCTRDLIFILPPVSRRKEHLNTQAECSRCTAPYTLLTPLGFVEDGIALLESDQQTQWVRLQAGSAPHRGKNFTYSGKPPLMSDTTQSSNVSDLV